MTGPAVDFGQLKTLLASPAAAKLPPELRARMQQDILANEQSQMAVQPDVSRITNPVVQAQQHATGIETAKNESLLGSAGGAGMQALFQVGHDLTFGIVKGPYSGDPATLTGIQSAAEIPIKLAAGFGTMAIQGYGLMKGLSFLGRVPIASRALEFIPGRLKEIGMGALINGGIDAMRIGGLDREPNGAINDPSWLDPSAKIAKPLAELGIPDRVALGMGGAVVGGIIGPVLMGIGAGYQAGRAARFASKLSPEEAQTVKDAIVRAGIDIGTTSSKYDIAKAFIGNMRKIHLNEQMGAVMADQLSKEQYISQEIAMGLGRNQQPLPTGQVISPLGEEEGKLVANIFRQNPGGVNVVTGVTSTEALEVARQRLGVKLLAVEVERGPTTVRAFRGTTNDPLVPGHGGALWLTDNIDSAEAYASRTGTQGNTHLVEYTSDKTLVANDWEDAYKKVMKKAFPKDTEVDEIHDLVVAEARKQGHDMILVKDGMMGDREFVPLNPSKAKVLGLAQDQNQFSEVASRDLFISRPRYEYPKFEDQATFSRITNKITEAMKKAATTAAGSVTAKRTVESFILADGTPIRGGLNLNAMTEKIRLQKPVVGGVDRGDLALKEAGKFVRMELKDGGKLEIELPRQLSQEQFNAVGQAVDAMKFNEVTVSTFDGKSQAFDTPIGTVVQDHIVDMVPPKSVGSNLTPELISQYQRTGVFNGQAAVLPDGTVAKVLNKAGAVGYKVEEQLTGKQFIVHHKNLTLLPHALEGELQTSNLFTSYLSDAERNSLAQLRQSIAQGWADPIKKYRDFESFANTRGYMANSLRGGKVELMKVNEGQGNTVKFDNLPAAVEWVRKDSGPVAELSADDVTKLLGPDRHMGFIGGGGPPPRFNEMMPINWERQQRTLESLAETASPRAGQAILKPMLPFLRDLDTRFGTQMYPAAYNMQTQGVARDNFTALWYHGKDGTLPNGVLPLKKIIQMAGKDADPELISHWLESPDSFSKANAEARMNKAELASANELRKWYDAAYPALGINAPFVENYMPHYREFLQSGNVGTFSDFMASIGHDPLKLPKGADFVSDHMREGTIDAYEQNAFAVAQQYLRAGAKNRFMKTAQDEAREIVRGIAAKSPNLALPLANMLQAMGGYEFAEQRAMLNETFKALIDKVPNALKVADKNSIAERFTDWSTSLVYASTMGFRPSLALRNAKDIFVMAYPIYHGPRFMEAVGHALTQAGKEEAMAARAISSYGGAMLNLSESSALEKLPDWAKNLQHASTVLYDSADDFTRAGTFFAAKYKAEEALSKFAVQIDKGLSKAGLDRAVEGLVRDSKMYMHGDQVQSEFLRLAGNDPDKAAQYAGKIASDMTNFIYGRGMQARWMRSISGRLMGQFGSWSMWYYDYLTRMTRAMVSGPYKADAFGALARHALINAAIVGVGKEILNVDLSRWASYGSLFYSGGPGTQIAIGAMTLQRGLSDASTAGEDPLAQSRITQGSQMIWQTLPAFVPFYSAGRDVIRMARTGANFADDPQLPNATDFLAATLGTRTTKDFQAQRKVDILLGDFQAFPFSSTSPALHTQLNNQASGRGVQPVDLRSVQNNLVRTPGVSNPLQNAPGTQSGGSPSVQLKGNLKTRLPAAAFPGEVRRGSTIEPKPSGGY